MNQILVRLTSRFHYGSKVPAVTITVFITILEQNRYKYKHNMSGYLIEWYSIISNNNKNCQSSTKFSEVNVKNNFTSHIDRQIFLTYLLTSLSLYIFTIWKCIAYYRLCRDGIYFNKILVSEYKLFKRSTKANLLIALVSSLFLRWRWRFRISE